MNEKQIDPNFELMSKLADDKVYILKVRCTNCDLQGVVRVKKGSKFDTRKEPCGNCGCHTLMKVSAP
jgi:ribosomal protein S27AE